MPRRRTRESRKPRFSAFAFRLLAYLFLASLPFSVFGLHRHMEAVQRALATAVGAAANALGAGVTVAGHVIYTRGAGLEVNHECTGIFVLLVYGAFILAYPASWRSRLSGIAVGASTLVAVNFARLVVLALVAGRWPEWLGYLHEYFFQGVFLAVLGLMAAAWTERVRDETLARVSG